MSETNSSQSQLGRAERSAALDYHRSKESDYIKIIVDQGKTVRQTYEEYARSLIKRIELKDEELEINDITQISSYVGRKTKATEAQRGYIREILGPLGCTDSKHDGSDKRSELRFENLKVLENAVTPEFIQSLDTNGRQVLHQIFRTGKDKVEKVADEKGEALVNHEPNKNKTSTEPDKNPGFSEEYYGADDPIENAQEIPKYLIAVRDKIFNNPAHKATKEERREIAQRIRSYDLIQKPFIQFLRSCVDEKYSFTLWQHAEMRKNIDTRSKHGAAVKAAIPVMRNGVLTDEVRKMTRERAGDEAEEILQWMKEFSDAMKLSAYWMGYVEWRDVKSTLNNRIAARKVDLAPDLSEKSIG